MTVELVAVSRYVSPAKSRNITVAPSTEPLSEVEIFIMTVAVGI